MSQHGPESLPDDLPRPIDDGAADHLPGASLPAVALPSTSGGAVDLGDLGPGRTVLYLYPRTGEPDVDVPADWDQIPGARGCTPEACGFRDHHADLTAVGVTAVYGVSTQSTDYQREVVDRLQLPYAMLSDEHLRLAAALRLPTFEYDGDTLYRRLTMIVDAGTVEHVFYPVFPPDEHAQQVLDWFRGDGTG